jgi:hypothetical protein
MAVKHRVRKGEMNALNAGRKPANVTPGTRSTGHRACPSLIGSLAVGRLRSRHCLFRLISAPRKLWGAEMAGLL